MRSSSSQPAFEWFTPRRFALGLAVLVMAMFPQVVLGWETFVARDYGFFVYPLAHFQRECFWHGELPFWDPYNNCGVPFLAQWNTMPLYPPALLYLTLPLGWSLSFFSLLHLWFAGLGMYWLARRWTVNPLAAAFAGTVFSCNGFTLNLLMWPSHMATFSWLPWVVLATESAWREGGKKIPLAAFAGAMQMLAGGPETIALTWLIAGLLWLQGWFLGETPRGRILWRLPLVAVLVFALSAAQLLPFLDLVAHAQRETGYTDLRWSMPGSGLANFLVPMAFGTTATEGIFFQVSQFWTSSYYLGVGTAWLAVMTLLAWPALSDRRIKLLALLAILAVLCAWGDHTPFYPWLRKLVPQLSFITYPIKFIMVAVFALPLLAATALAKLQETPPGTVNRRLFAVGAVLLGLMGGIVVWTQNAPPSAGQAHLALASGISRAAFLAATGGLLFLLTRFRKTQWVPVLLMVLAWLDVYTHEPRQNPTAPPDIYQTDLARRRQAMNPQPELGGSRAMLSPAAVQALTWFAVSDPQNNFLAKRVGGCANANLLDNLPKVDGFFSLAPHDFDNLLSHIYGIPNGNWTALEDFMGVSQFSSTNDFLTWQPRRTFLPLVTAGQQPVFLDDDRTLLALAQNKFTPTNQVFLPPEARSLVTVDHPTQATVQAAKFTQETVDFTVQAAEPSLAVVAQSYYHNWRAEVDGHPALLLRANAAFQAVPVPAGTHQVHLSYRDRGFEIGAAISLCMWVNCFVSYLALRRRELPPSPAPKNGDYF